ncbi:hypothetical protein PRUPE_1G055400 [Prunus persica]|uniref:DUF4283 domain-containing protein n=1 Tax=Prunus persica TaxID=3760 RepID=A0A251QW14_PRUPE|nr:uncharacterized protein LOC109946690 [Prunus persica]ONI26925.1 hypothetical protein PRUPE_1G055400 [Prunus persica]
MTEFVFCAEGPTKDGPSAGGKRARTKEILDADALEPEAPPPPLPPIPMSFKDKVAGDFGMAEEQMEIGDDDVIIKSRTIPSIQFSDKIKNALYRPWLTAVIIKLMGRPLAYTFLRARLLQEWELKGPMNLIDLENSYFIVKFVYEEDMKYVLTSGPWQIAGQYVVTQKWKLGFNAQEEKISHMTAWVRINGLNVEYFRYDVMEKIGNLIGNTIKVDANTMSQARGKFARICIELDLAKPLTPFIEVEGRTYGVVYEGINLVCFECGCYDHGRDTCPIIVQAKQQAADSVDTEGMEMNNTNKTDDLQVDNPTTLAAENPAKIHREWMLMKTRNFKKKVLNDSGKGAEISKRNPKNSNDYNGSRFNVLNEEGKSGNGIILEEFPPVKATALG